MANEIEKSTPKTKGIRGFSKLWQTLGEYTTLPFTPVEAQAQIQIEGKIPNNTIIEDLQLFLNKDLDSTSEAGATEVKDYGLEDLSKELIQIFDFDNLERSTTSQKEKLVQKVIKLGGEGYTAEDLKRDILNIQLEENDRRQDKQMESKSKDSQTIDRIDMDDMTEIENNDLEKDGLGDKICMELENKEFDRIEECTSPTAQVQVIY